MKPRNLMRNLKRSALKRDGVTFTMRFKQAARDGKPVAQVRFHWNGKQMETKQA